MILDMARKSYEKTPQKGMAEKSGQLTKQCNEISPHRQQHPLQAPLSILTPIES
jgi:hypothetical protein